MISTHNMEAHVFVFVFFSTQKGSAKDTLTSTAFDLVKTGYIARFAGTECDPIFGLTLCSVHITRRKFLLAQIAN